MSVQVPAEMFHATGGNNITLAHLDRLSACRSAVLGSPNIRKLAKNSLEVKRMSGED